MKETVEGLIENYIADFSRTSSISWGRPHTGFARADDPLFARLKEIVRPSHELPRDFLEQARTVVSFFLPFKEEVVESNKEGRYSSKLWGIAYIETNRLINEMNKYLKSELTKMGYQAAYVPATHNFDEEALMSDWSHRSAAYIAGVGTFGLNHMLITESGCCGRIGSLITDLEVEPTPRYGRELCLYRADGSCGQCVKRCVNDALHFEGLDRQRCYKMLLENGERLSDLESLADVCGKCLVDVPCSTGIPRPEE